MRQLSNRFRILHTTRQYHFDLTNEISRDLSWTMGKIVLTKPSVNQEFWSSGVGVMGHMGWKPRVSISWCSWWSCWIEMVIHILYWPITLFCLSRVYLLYTKSCSLYYHIFFIFVKKVVIWNCLAKKKKTCRCTCIRGLLVVWGILFLAQIMNASPSKRMSSLNRYT